MGYVTGALAYAYPTNPDAVKKFTFDFFTGNKVPPYFPTPGVMVPENCAWKLRDGIYEGTIRTKGKSGSECKEAMENGYPYERFDLPMRVLRILMPVCGFKAAPNGKNLLAVTTPFRQKIREMGGVGVREFGEADSESTKG